MIERLITSSLLIGALLLLRGAFRRALSRRVQYALWGLVLLRLLIPFQLPAADFSVLTTVQPVRAAVARELARRPAPIPPADTAPLPAAPQSQPRTDPAAPAEDLSVPEPEPAGPAAPTAAEVLAAIRWTGTALAAAGMLWANLRFWQRLRRCRRVYPTGLTARQVYLTEGALASPCLFGLVRPAIYLTPGAAASPERLRHVLAHEETHARHLDPLWALLRCVCLALYWFDPLVWIAAAASKTDCELACDEGALLRLGEEERIPYGQTLLSLIPVRRSPASPLLAATTMTAGKKQLRDRISRIAQKPKQLAAAAVAAAVLAGVVSACTFTGAATAPAEPTPGPVFLEGWGEPESVISLAEVQPCDPEPYPVLAVKTEWNEQAELYREGNSCDIWLLTSYQEQTQYFAVVDKRLEHLEYRCFLALPLGDGGGFTGGGGFDEGLFGWDGPVDAITYWTDAGYVTEYVCIGADGSPIRLARVRGDMSETFHMDCDGDGNAEVVAPAQLLFQRDGAVYLADIAALWAEAKPDYVPDYLMDWSQWDPGTGLMKAAGMVQGADGVYRNWVRYLRFDGENLLVYRDPRTCEDHVMSNIDAPQAVVDKARELVESWMPKPGDVLGRGPEPESEPLLATAEYDGWRVESITGPEELRVGGITLHVYRFNYEYHTTTPTEVIVAGGIYITEDDWVMPGYPDCDYLFFRLEEDGALTYLWHEMSNDVGPEQMVEDGLRRLGLLDADPAYLAQGLWDTITAREEVFMTLAPADGSEVLSYTTATGWGWNMPRDIIRDFHWETVEEVDPAQLEGCAVLRVGQEELSLTSYQGSGLVAYRNGGDRRWFRAEQAVRDDIFAYELFEYVRQWFDEIETEALERDIAVPDDGRSREELARAWIEQYEGTHLLAAAGSKEKWTYLDIRDVRVDTERDREFYPADLQDRESFLFWYSAVFVPENETALHWSMAGNTGEYEGEDAPENALQWWRCGYLYQDGNVWRCDGTGTGP